MSEQKQAEEWGLLRELVAELTIVSVGKHVLVYRGNDDEGTTKLWCQCGIVWECSESDKANQHIAEEALNLLTRKVEEEKRNAFMDGQLDTNARAEALDEWRESLGKHLCGCELDGHGQICMAHAPKIQQLEKRIAELEAS